MRSMPPLGEVIAPSRSEADFSQPKSLRQIVQTTCPDIIVNAVAYTAVDKAEGEASLAHAVNADAPGVLAEEAKRVNALFVHYSTDYVFDGAKLEPYVESDKPSPINVYGRTKLAGECNVQATDCRHLIFRTSWVYSPRGHNFVNTILRMSKQPKELRIVNDQFGAPTSARFIADTTNKILSGIFSQADSRDDRRHGIYHLTPAGYTSWYGFAQTILDSISLRSSEAEIRPTLTPISTEEYPLPARRPKNSRLNCDLLGIEFEIYRPEWKVGIQQFLDDGATLSKTQCPQVSDKFT